MLKKILSFALALLIVGSMAACKKNPEKPDDGSNPGTEQPGENTNPGGENNNPGGENNNPGGENTNPDGEQPEEITWTTVNENVQALVTAELRREPQADVANIVGELRVNQVVKRIAVSSDGKWSKVHYEANDLAGDYYVASNCLQIYVGELPGPGTNPGEGTTNPGEGTTNPGEGTTNPGEGTTNPGEGTTNPGDGTTNPDAFVPASGYVYVCTDALNLRREPNGEVLGQVVFGSKLECVEKNNTWYKVKVDGQFYYVSAAYVTVDDVTGNSFKIFDTPVVKTVTADTLKKRKSPWMDPTDENVAGYLSKGTKLTCVAISPDGYWYRIQDTDGQYYYVGAKYMSGFVAPSTPSNPDENTPSKPTLTFTDLTPTTMYTAKANVSMYASPDPTTAPVMNLGAGTQLTCTAVSSDQVWYKATLPGQTVVYYVLVADVVSGGK